MECYGKDLTETRTGWIVTPDMSLVNIDSYVLSYCFSFLSPRDLESMTCTSKQMKLCVDVAVKLVLEHLTLKYMSAPFMKPEKIMKSGNLIVRRYLKLACAYIKMLGNRQYHLS